MQRSMQPSLKYMQQGILVTGPYNSEGSDDSSCYKQWLRSELRTPAIRIAFARRYAQICNCGTVISEKPVKCAAYILQSAGRDELTLSQHQAGKPSQGWTTGQHMQSSSVFTDNVWVWRDLVSTAAVHRESAEAPKLRRAEAQVKSRPAAETETSSGFTRKETRT